MPDSRNIEKRKGNSNPYSDHTSTSVPTKEQTCTQKTRKKNNNKAMPHSNKDAKFKFKDLNGINKPSGIFANLEFPNNDEK